MKNITYLLIILFVTVFTACDSDEVNTKSSIFDIENLPATNKFDEWLYDNYTAPYNIQFNYRFNLMESDIKYYLTPARIDKAAEFVQLLKYCWLEGYEEVAGVDFIKETSPKEITLVGSQALEPGSKVLGHASGGQRITLFEVNTIDNIDFESTISHMHVIHHEFSHILDQKKAKDASFEQISMGNYLGDFWSDAKDLFGEKGMTLYQAGFVSEYSTTDAEEDYAEVLSIYLVGRDPRAKSLTTWDDILANARKKIGENPSAGEETILKKLQMVREYLKEEWNIDLEELRDSVQRRAKNASSLEPLPFIDELTK